jgi:hypothetical protein
MSNMQPSVVLPFGRHKGQSPESVPTDYLHWFLSEVQLSSGLRAALAEELARRGRPVPQPPAPRPVPACPRCPGAPPALSWQEDAAGQRRIRAECSRCRRFLAFAPQVEPYVGEADRAGSHNDLLDVLTRLDELEVELRSDGTRVYFAAGDYRRVPAELAALVRSCSHRLARMIGDTSKISTSFDEEQT